MQGFFPVMRLLRDLGFLSDVEDAALVPAAATITWVRLLSSSSTMIHFQKQLMARQLNVDVDKLSTTARSYFGCFYEGLEK